MGKRALSSTATMADAMELVKSGEWTLDDVTAWDASRAKTIIVSGDNLSGGQFVTLTKLDTPDPIKRELFIGKDKLTAKPKRFSTGSVGYNLNGKVHLMVGGKQAKFQFTGNMVLVNSKPIEGETTTDEGETTPPAAETDPADGAIIPPSEENELAELGS